MSLYRVTATVATELGDGWTSTRQVPTFLLDSRIQGIVSEDHAERIARDLVQAVLGGHDDGTTTVSLSVSECAEVSA